MGVVAVVVVVAMAAAPADVFGYKNDQPLLVMFKNMWAGVILLISHLTVELPRVNLHFRFLLFMGGGM